MNKLLLIALLLSFNAYADCTAEVTETDFSEFDLNGDGMVNLDDFYIFRDVFGSSGEIGDFNADGIVNLIDFGLFRNAYGVHETTTIVRCGL